MVVATSPDCYTEGNIEYYYCSRCGLYFADEACTVQLSEADVTIPATGHQFEQTWSYDENYHWRAATCGHDNIRGEEGRHQFVEQDNGYEYYEICSDCNYKIDHTATITANYNQTNNVWYFSLGTSYSSTSARENIWLITFFNVSLATNGCNSIELVANAFSNCSNLKRVDLQVYNNRSLTGIGQSAFGGCTSLTEITIPASVKHIDSYAFSGCTSLQKITFEKGSLLESIGEAAFSGCSSLTSIELPDGVTSIGDSAFKNCSSLTSIELPDGVTSIGNSAFRGCSSLTSIELPDSVSSIGSVAFSGCSGLTSITLPDSITSIESYAFSDCSKLTNISIPDSVTSIGENAFSSCIGLTSITIGNGVTSIGDGAFSLCWRLVSITIGNRVTSIGDEAFYYCGGLTSVYYAGSAEEWESISIDSSNTNLIDATRYYYVENEADVPTDGGNYWHYDTDGVTPVVWTKKDGE